MRKVLEAYRVGGSIRVPPSKSSMQRAVACALLAEGESRLLRPSRSSDCLAALGVAAALGAELRDLGEEIRIRGGLAVPPSAAPGIRLLGCGESGLCIRMFAPIAALLPGPSLLEAEGSLRSRPLGMLDGALESLGASCSSSEGRAPLRVEGPLRGGEIEVPAEESSQFVTGLLIALAAAEGDSRLRARGLVSGGYVDLTLDTMESFGVHARREGPELFLVPGGQSYKATVFEIEGDWSGAAFLLVAGALAAGPRGLRLLGLPFGSSQPDRAILDAMELAGAVCRREGAELHLETSRLSGFEFDASDCPDLFPPLVALASHCEGETRLRGATRLRAKESDRGQVLREEFGRLGVELRLEGDLLRIRGGRFGGGLVRAHGDHRIAMAAAVAALPSGGVEIEGAECVAKSWPTFFEDLESLRLP